ncbi:MAG: hypothetical protein JSS03_09695, partial [Proteobacteria bacterium]|nr:hypothetical protein [Pseudomonadota bacterium]
PADQAADKPADQASDQTTQNQDKPAPKQRMVLRDGKWVPKDGEQAAAEEQHPAQTATADSADVGSEAGTPPALLASEGSVQREPIPENVRGQIAANLQRLAGTQTRYMGNKREFFDNNAQFVADHVAPLTQHATTLFDMYAGGGTYGITHALSGAMPNVKRVVVNEADPVLADRFRIAVEHGGDKLMEPWTTDPKLVELKKKLEPLAATSMSPVLTAIRNYEGDISKSRKFRDMYAWAASLGKSHGELSPASRAALLALKDVIFSGRTAKFDHLFDVARDDANRINDLVKQAHERGIRVDLTGHDALGPDAEKMVRDHGGNAVVLLDPPYHKSASGTYSANGKSYKFASGEFLHLNLSAARAMSGGNVVLYHNKHTDTVRSGFRDAFGGNVSESYWARALGGKEYFGVYDGRNANSDARVRVGEQSGSRTEPAPKGVVGERGVSGRIGDDANNSSDAAHEGAIRRDEHTSAGAGAERQGVASDSQRPAPAADTPRQSKGAAEQSGSDAADALSDNEPVNPLEQRAAALHPIVESLTHDEAYRAAEAIGGMRGAARLDPVGYLLRQHPDDIELGGSGLVLQHPQCQRRGYRLRHRHR